MCYYLFWFRTAIHWQDQLWRQAWQDLMLAATSASLAAWPVIPGIVLVLAATSVSLVAWPVIQGIVLVLAATSASMIPGITYASNPINFCWIKTGFGQYWNFKSHYYIIVFTLSVQNRSQWTSLQARGHIRAWHREEWRGSWQDQHQERENWGREGEGESGECPRVREIEGEKKGGDTKVSFPYIVK